MTTTNLFISFDGFAIESCESTDSSNSSDSLLASAADPLSLVAAHYYPDDDENVQLEVSGNSFVLNTYDFQKLAALPWKRIHESAFRLDGTSPEVFQQCIDYVVFETLPKKKKMSPTERQELVAMASTLQMTELMDHMMGRSNNKKKKNNKRRGSTNNAASYNKPKKTPTTITTTTKKKSKTRFGGWFSCSRTKKSDVESNSKSLTAI